VRSVLETVIAAPPALVFALVHDPERWPRLLPHYAGARVVNVAADDVRTIEFVARRPLIDVLGLGFPVAWRSRTWSDADALTVRFRHAGGVTDGMDVTWRIQPARGGCRVSIEHDFDRWPEVYPRLVNRLFIRPIAGRTLATFKALAETLAEIEGRDRGDRESTFAPATNLPT